MKKINKIITVLGAAVVLTGVSGVLTACDSTNSNASAGTGTAEKAEITNTYILNETETTDIGTNYIVHQLQFLDDGTYELVTTTYAYGYSMNLGTYSVDVFGDFTKGTSEDGYTAYTLKRADRVIVNAYSLAGGFNIAIDTETTSYPVELPATTQGEKNMAQDKDDVVDAYGAEMTIYAADDTNMFSLTNPNA